MQQHGHGGRTGEGHGAILLWPQAGLALPAATTRCWLVLHSTFVPEAFTARVHLSTSPLRNCVVASGVV